MRNRSLLSSLVCLLLVLHGLLVGGALSYALGDIGVHNSIALSALEVNASLLGELLESGTLPLWQPALWIRLLAWVLWVKVLGILDVSLSLLGWHEDLSSSFSLLDYILRLFLLAFFRHAIINEPLNVILFVFRWSLVFR
jgi:hypothetical protein